jgi:DNA ligase-1
MSDLIFMKAVNCDLAKIRYPVKATPKVDGVAGEFLREGLTARTGRPFTNSLVTDVFSHPALRGFCGEFTVGSLVDGATCRRTTSLLNSLRSNRIGELPVWNIFDYVTEHTHRMGALDRYRICQNEIAGLPPEIKRFINPLPFMKICNNLEEVLAFHEYTTGLGYEGTMLKWVNAPHKGGRSTVSKGELLRIKDQETSEAIILDFVEAEENLNEIVLDHLGYSKRSSHKENKVGNGMLGSFKCLWEGKKITVAAGELDHNDRVEIWETRNDVAPKLARGDVITFKHMKYGAKDLPRFARFVVPRKDDQ